jgi:hypothetical protein
MGMTQKEIGRKATVGDDTVTRWIRYKSLVDAGVVCAAQTAPSVLIEISNPFENDITTIQTLLNICEQKDYNKHQARALAQAYKNAETQELKEQVLKTGVGKNDTWEDVLHKARFEKATRDQFPETFVFIPDWERELLSNENTHPYVKKFYNSINSARRHILLGPLFVQQDLFKPEQAKATIHKIDETIKELDEYKKSLMGVINE